jgi:hypothetical protein
LANARGFTPSREGTELEADAEAISWMCPYAICLYFAEVDRRSWLREALLPNVVLRKRDGSEWWTGAWPTDVFNRSQSRPLFQAARPVRTRLFAAKLCVAEGAVGDEKIDSRRAGCATPRKPARSVRKGGSGPEEELSQANPRGTGCAIPTRKSGRRAAYPSSNEGALDREKLRRVTAARWNRSRRVSPNRPSCVRETCTTRYRGKIATGASEAGRRVRGQAQQAPTVRRRSAEAIARVVKRTDLRSRWAAPQRVHAQCLSQEEDAGDDEPERDGYGCSLTECREAETAQTYL